MKITYEFDNGDVMTVEASDEIGAWILASRRREAADDKYHHRYCYSLDAVNDKSEWMQAREYNPEDMMDRFIARLEEEHDRACKRERLKTAMTHLTEKEKDLMNAMIYDGKTQAAYAREHGCDKGLISRRYKAAMKKIKKYF